MRRVVLNSVKDMQFEQVQEPALETAHDVKLRIKAVGVCGSDLHYYTEGRIGDFVVKEPLVLGHEASAEVIEKGSKVSHLEVGDLVAVEPGVPCRRCKECKEGRYNLCPDMRFMATPPIDGALQEYVIHPADFCVPVKMDPATATLFEPLSVAIHVIKNKVALAPGMRIAVTGCGPVGLLMIHTLSSMGIGNVVALEKEGFRSGQAEKLGARVYNDIPQMQQALLEMGGADCIVECSGSRKVLEAMVEAVAPNAHIVCVGMGAEMKAELNLAKILPYEAHLSGIFRYANTYTDAVAMVSSGKLSLDGFVTRRFPFDKTIDAFDYSLAHGHEGIKTVIEF